MDTKYKRTNGRVDLIEYPKTGDLFKIYDKNPVNQISTYRSATEGIWDETMLSRAYFSRENITIIQNAIRKGVYERSNQQYIIGNQSLDDIKIIMRSIFLQNAKNFGNIQQQIISLNDLVIATCVQKIFSEAVGYMKYIKDASTLVVPLENPVLCNHLDKNLEFRSFF